MEDDDELDAYDRVRASDMDERPEYSRADLTAMVQAAMERAEYDARMEQARSEDGWEMRELKSRKAMERQLNELSPRDTTNLEIGDSRDFEDLEREC